MLGREGLGPTGADGGGGAAGRSRLPLRRPPPPCQVAVIALLAQVAHFEERLVIFPGFDEAILIIPGI